MAILARYQATAQDDAGNVLTSPSVEVRLESTGALVSLFSDRAGTVALGNPFTGGVDGLVAFHVAGGAYKITFTKDAVTRTLRYVAIATMAEIDDAPEDGNTYGRQNRTWAVAGGGGGGSFIADGGTTSRTPAAHAGDDLYIEDFGGNNNGTFDNTTAINAAIAAAQAAGGGTVRFSDGIYKFTGTLNISANYVSLEGAGLGTILQFEPTADDTAIFIGNGANILSYTRICGMWLRSADTTFQKIGIDASDVDFLYVDNFRLSGWAGGTTLWAGGAAGSIGIRTLGRDFIRVGPEHDATIQAERPLVIKRNANTALPSVNIDFDHCVIGAYLVAGDTYSVIEVENGAYISNSTFSGAWAGGTYGVYWVSTATPIEAASHNVQFRDLRIEQGKLSSAHNFYIDAQFAINGIYFDNIYLDASRHGIYLRDIAWSKITNCFYGDTSKVALDIDSTVQHLVLDNYFSNTGSTANITGVNRVYASNPPAGSILPGNAYYTVLTPAFNMWTAKVEPATGTATFSINPVAASQNADLEFKQSGTNKWVLRKSATDGISLMESAVGVAFQQNAGSLNFLWLRNLVPNSDGLRSIGFPGFGWSALYLSAGAPIVIGGVTYSLREKLTANRNYYVRKDGLDTNTGLNDNGTAGSGAFLTITKALNVCSGLDLGGFNVTIFVRGNPTTATYDESITVPQFFVGRGTVTIEGDTTTPSNITWACTTGGTYNLQVKGAAIVYVKGFKFTNTISFGFHLYAEGFGSYVYISGKVEFGAAQSNGGHMQAVSGGAINGTAAGSYTITSGCANHMNAQTQGIISMNATKTLSGTLTFGTFALAKNAGQIADAGAYTGGTISGTRYSATYAGIIDTFGGGANFYPGSVAGTPAPGVYGTNGGIYL